MSSTHVTLGGVETLARAWGAVGDPPVVVLHSAGLDGASLDTFAHQLVRAGRSVVAPDLRGHGSSRATPGDVALDAMAADVVELAAMLGERPVELVGTSMGGVVAGLAVELAPRAWSSLAVVCSPDRGYPSFAERATAVADGGMAGHVETTLQRWFTPEQLASPHPAVAHCRERLASFDPACWDAVWRDFATFDGWSAVGGTVPMLTVAGALDASTPPAVVERLAEAAGGTTHVVADAPHQLLMTHAGEAAALVTA